MNRIFTLSAIVLFLASCASSKFRAPASEDKPLFAAINELIKHPDNAKAQNDLRYFYGQSIARHEEAARVYSNSNDASRWDKLIREYNALQTIYNASQAVPNITAYVQPKSFLNELENTRVDAAEYYYREGLRNLDQQNRAASLRAHELFKKVSNYVSGYKDALQLSKEAYENSIVDVMVGPFREEDPLFFRSWDEDTRYRSDYYQENLVRELGGSTAAYTSARFFTDYDASRQNIRPDWVLDLEWDNVTPGTGLTSTSSRNLSKKIQVGKDTTGKPKYETVTGTLYVHARTVSARATIEFRLWEVYSKRTITTNRVTESVEWREEYATFEGDKRALSDEERALLRQRNFDRGPSKTQVMDALIRKMFPELKSKIIQIINNS